MPPDRLDKLLVQRGLARSRGEAHTLIASGQVMSDGTIASKPSMLVDQDADLAVHGGRLPYVSRGGLKLAAALDHFTINPASKSALDIGASTGGWTDCLLQRGVERVVALDVGHGQMVSRIATDSRVELREGVNARFLTRSDFADQFDLIVADLSFISLTLVLAAIAPLVRSTGDIVLLVKPQFEVGAERLGKGGIVRDEAARLDSVARVANAADSLGLREAGRMGSPITGTNGNIEYLLWLRPEPNRVDEV